ncbi:hypothetical protein JB92DRAFT_2831724 [Gautieria morchelliformis]|nr:hypothetical protein JB92DRAFT_2831724 [Gautieria morchelliformis]
MDYLVSMYMVIPLQYAGTSTGAAVGKPLYSLKGFSFGLAKIHPPKGSVDASVDATPVENPPADNTWWIFHRILAVFFPAVNGSGPKCCLFTTLAFCQFLPPSSFDLCLHVGDTMTLLLQYQPVSSGDLLFSSSYCFVIVFLI